MTTIHTRQLTTIHTRYLKIQHVQKVNNTKVRKYYIYIYIYRERERERESTVYRSYSTWLRFHGKDENKT